MNSDDLKQLVESNYLQYASYVILDRAIPDIIDGLKPVQRRILATLFEMHDGRLHKVANVVGQTMALHPHGDQSIAEALITLANRGFLLDRQGNFGNALTGDSAAAPRYIETRLSKLSLETVFNPKLTAFQPSYDGRKQEPKAFPVKIPLVLLQGAEGIAVGMSTRIFSHNFNEVLEAQIAYLKGESFELYPDFITGGQIDASEYDQGRGKVRVRAKVDIADKKTLVVREICPGTTTESLIRSIDDAAKKGRIRIDSINDYTSEQVEVEVKLPRGQHAEDILNKLYAYTDCEVILHSQIIVVRDGLPWETSVNEIIKFYSDQLVDFVRQELEIERDRLNETIFYKSLEQIFIEDGLYKILEKKETLEEATNAILDGFKPYHGKLLREPTADDVSKLLNIPIRRISRFDRQKQEEDIAQLNSDLEDVEKKLTRVKAEAIRQIKQLLKQYGADYPRRSQIKELEQINRKEMDKRNIDLGYDHKTGFIGAQIKGHQVISCTNQDKLLILYKDGGFLVINPTEDKRYIKREKTSIIYVGIIDKEKVFNVVYIDSQKGSLHAKRFKISKYILEKEYSFLDDGQKLMSLTTEESEVIHLKLKKKARQKVNELKHDFCDVPVKGVSSRGIRLTTKEVDKLNVISTK